MAHMVQKHGGQQLIQESVAHLRRLDRAACVLCDTVRSRGRHRCCRCKRDTPLRDFIVGDTIQDRRQGCSARGLVHHSPTSSQLAASATKWTFLTIKWAIGDLPAECRFLRNTQLMFLKKEKDPTSKQFDDDEWIRSLTEAREITADVPEDSVLFD